MSKCDKSKKQFYSTTEIKEILDELEICKDDYYRTLVISKDEDLGLNSKRQPNSCFVDNYFNIDLKV